MFEDFDYTNEAPNNRVIAFGNNKMFVKRSDPFGFWSVSFERGAPPEFLRGQYTSFEEAFKDVQKYILARKEEPPQRPVDVLNKK